MKRLFLILFLANMTFVQASDDTLSFVATFDSLYKRGNKDLVLYDDTYYPAIRVAAGECSYSIVRDANVAALTYTEGADKRLIVKKTASGYSYLVLPKNEKVMFVVMKKNDDVQLLLVSNLGAERIIDGDACPKVIEERVIDHHGFNMDGILGSRFKDGGTVYYQARHIRKGEFGVLVEKEVLTSPLPGGKQYCLLQRDDLMTAMFSDTSLDVVVSLAKSSAGGESQMDLIDYCVRRICA
jgi:hypothetical protein